MVRMLRGAKNTWPRFRGVQAGLSKSYLDFERSASKREYTFWTSQYSARRYDNEPASYRTGVQSTDEFK